MSGTGARACVALVIVAVAGCEAMAPALTQLGIAFGQNFMAASSANYSPRYAVQVEQLLVAMAREMSGLQFQAQLAASGYVPPPPRYGRHAAGVWSVDVRSIRIRHADLRPAAVSEPITVRRRGDTAILKR